MQAQGQTQGRYTILGEIASGATATVFLAEDIVLRRKVALKKLHPHLWNHTEAVRRFEKEAVAVASLSHENIIKVYDFGSQDRGLFLAMEYVDGSSLESLMPEPDKGLPNLTALSIFHQLLAGLAAAHTAGIYHRDIKPSNVLVDTKGCVRIADFGIAFLSVETSITKTGSYLGTPGYSAPEQAQGLPTTDKTDIFATGILFYRCLTGRLPFAAETPHAVLIAIMEKVPAKANFVNPRLIPGLAELVEEMLAKDPEQRPNAQRCLEKLETLAGRHGFPLDAARICRFSADPLAYAASEYREIAVGFLNQARRAQAEGRQRDAMKDFSLAEIFAEADSDVGREAAGFLAGMAARMRRKKRIWVTLMLLGAFCVGYGIFRLLAERAGRNMAAAPVSIPLPAPTPTPIPTPIRTPIAAALPVEQAQPHPAPRPLSRGKPIRVSLRKEQAARKAVPARTAVVPSLEAADPAAAAAPGYVLVKSNPPFAKIRIDGKLMGTTPLKAPLELASGSHQLDLEREGCAPLHANFRILSGETASLRYSLDRDARTEP